MAKKCARATITAPAGPIGYRNTLHGTVFPPNSPVQVMVFSHDQLWYPQPMAEVKGRKWRSKVFFGKPRFWKGDYVAAAAAGGTEITEPVADLPADRSWTKQKINRSE